MRAGTPRSSAIDFWKRLKFAFVCRHSFLPPLVIFYRALRRSSFGLLVAAATCLRFASAVFWSLNPLVPLLCRVALVPHARDSRCLRPPRRTPVPTFPPCAPGTPLTGNPLLRLCRRSSLGLFNLRTFPPLPFYPPPATRYRGLRPPVLPPPSFLLNCFCEHGNHGNRRALRGIAGGQAG